jgi:hypothetical protein
MNTITLTGGEFGGETAEVANVGSEVRIARGARVYVYEAREVEDEDGTVRLVGVFVRSERARP